MIKYETMARRQGKDAAEQQRAADREAAMAVVRAS